MFLKSYWTQPLKKTWNYKLYGLFLRNHVKNSHYLFTLGCQNKTLFVLYWLANLGMRSWMAKYGMRVRRNAGSEECGFDQVSRIENGLRGRPVWDDGDWTLFNSDSDFFERTFENRIRVLIRILRGKNGHDSDLSKTGWITYLLER